MHICLVQYMYSIANVSGVPMNDRSPAARAHATRDLVRDTEFILVGVYMDMHTDAVPFDPVDAVLSDSDILFHIFCQLTDVAILRPVVAVSKTLRAAALRADLPLWWSCDEESFCALESPEAAESLLPRLISRITRFSSSSEDSRSRRWHCNSVLALLQTHWRHSTPLVVPALFLLPTR